MASVYNRSGTLWIACYKNGKQVRKSANLPDTKENRKRIEKELLPKLEQAELNPNSKTFAYYKSIYLISKEQVTTETTMRKYILICNKFEQFFKRKIAEIKASEVRMFLATLGLSPKTFRSYLSVMNGIFKEAIYDDALGKNPCDVVELPRLKKPDIQLFSKAEIQSLTSGEGWFDNLVGTAFFTGVRTGELIALRWSDISFEHRSIRIERNFAEGSLNNCKTDGSLRTIPMFDEAYFYLQRQYLNTGLRNSYVFMRASTNEHYSDAKQVHSTWKAHCRERDVIHKVMYNTRHTFAVTLLESELFSVMDIARFMGHSTTQMLFSRYAKHIKSEKKNFELSLGFDLQNKHNLNTKTS